MSQPPNYNGTLSQEGREIREDLEQKLSDLYASLDGLEGITRLRALKRIDTADFPVEYQGANPKEIDFKVLRDHIREADVEDDPLINKYRARISSRATAIRAMCVMCQGGVVAAVKDCVSITCTLHPFRMGKDPLRGWLPPPTVVIEIADEDGPDLFEDGDDDDGDANVD